MHSCRILNPEPMLHKIRDSWEFFMELAVKPWPTLRVEIARAVAPGLGRRGCGVLTGPILDGPLPRPTAYLVIAHKKKPDSPCIHCHRARATLQTRPPFLCLLRFSYTAITIMHYAHNGTAEKTLANSYNSACVSHISVHLIAQALLTVAQDYLPKDVCRENSLWRYNVSLQRASLIMVQYVKTVCLSRTKAGRLTACYKRFSFLKLWGPHL